MELRSIGGYDLLDPLPSRSTHARLFRARAADEGPAVPPRYLVKLLAPSRGPKGDILRAQFAHECRLLRACNHPAIPTHYASGEQDGVPFLVMDYVDGVDLAHLLGHDTGAPRGVTKPVAVYLLAQLASALWHVHSLTDPDQVDEDGEPLRLEVVHRDVTPSNILLSRHGDVLLSDFGSASSRWLAPEHDMDQAGTPAYMAPERLRARGRATERSELFSLAVILWELLRGERCFPSDDPIAVLDAIMGFDLRQSARRVSGLSPKLSEILRKNLDRDPERRYLHAYQVLQRLAQAPEAAEAAAARDELGRMVAACMA